MAPDHVTAVLGQIRKLALAPRPAEVPDHELVERFVDRRDEGAFEALLGRHGPMVLGLCRRLLRDEHEAEDVFQAAFLALARGAASLRRRGSVGSWLYGVSYRLALKSRAASRRRAARTGGLTPRRSQRPPAEPADEITLREARAILDEELARLPERHRATLVLCCIEGKARDEAAQALGCPLSTVKSRLEDARELLRRRLARRGLALSATLTALALSPASAAARASPPLLASTARAAAQLALASRPAASLWLKVAAGLALATGVLAAAGAVGDPASTPSPAQEPKQEAKSPPGKAADEKGPRVDREGNPLPEGALARVGSLRFRHPGWISRIAYAPDGRSIASVCRDGSLRLWDAATGRARWRLAVSKENYEGRLSFAPDGKTLAVLCLDEFTLVEAATGKVTHRRQWERRKDGDAVRCLAISPDRKAIARGCFDATVRIHDTTTGAEKHRIAVGDKARGEIPLGIAFAPDGKTLLVGKAGSKEVVVVDAGTGRTVRRLKGEQESVRGLVLSPDGRTLVTLSTSRDADPDRVGIWDLPTGAQRHLIRHSFPDPICGAISPDGKLLAVGSQGKDVVLFDVKAGKELRRLNWHPSVMSVAFSPDGQALATADNGGCIVLWDVASGKKLPASSEPSGGLGGLRFEAGGRQLFAYADGFTWWDWARGELVRHIPQEPSWSWGRTVASDGSLLAAADRKHRIRIIDATTGKELHRLEGHKSWVSSALFSPDGRLLFTVGSFDPRVLIWDVATGKRIHELKSHAIYADRLAVSPDGRTLASAAADAAARGDYDVRLWEVETGKLVRRLSPRRGSVFQIVFSPDASLLAGVGGEPGRPNDRGEVQVWEVATGRLRQTLEGHKERVTCVAISPDGRTLATGSLDGTFRLWELASGRERRRIVGHEAPVHSIAFAPDGRVLAAASDDAPTYIWAVYGTRPGGPLSEGERARLWEDLASVDAEEGYRAVCRLVADPAGAAGLLRERLKPVPAAEEEQVRRWLKDLDSPRFATRQRAADELAKVADAAASLLRKAEDDAALSAEVRKRLRAILAELESPAPERLRQSRALEVLEAVRTPEARQVLEALARGAAGARVTREAKEALDRLTPSRSSRR